jgi:hypothetical protein
VACWTQHRGAKRPRQALIALGGPSVPAPTVLGHWPGPHQWINIAHKVHIA